MKLDVGCGTSPTVDVNIDLFVNQKTLHVNSKEYIFIDGRKIPNPVKADAHFLPFKNNSFSEVVAFALVEHCNAPTRVVNEPLRVTNYKVIFTVPHWIDRESTKALKIGTHKIAFSSLN